MNYPRMILEARLEQGGGVNVVVNTTIPSVDVPMEFAHDGKIVLNLNLQKQPDLTTDDEGVFVTLSFARKIIKVSFPWYSIITIHCDEFVAAFDQEAVVTRNKAEQETKAAPAKKPNPFKVVQGGLPEKGEC